MPYLRKRIFLSVDTAIEKHIIVYVRGNMFIQVNFISGVMLGVEFLWDEKVLVLDLLIARFYIGSLPNE